MTNPSNEALADKLPEMADVLELPGIGPNIGRALVEIVTTGHWNQLDRLSGTLEPEKLFQTIPGIGPELAVRIHNELHGETLEQLEQAAHEGRLERVPGVGARRALAIKGALSERLGHRHFKRPLHAKGPPMAFLLDADREYREKASANTLRNIAPKPLNPAGEAWLPVLHTSRGEWQFTLLFSNTQRAHELNKTHDWVMVYFHTNAEPEAQCNRDRNSRSFGRAPCHQGAGGRLHCFLCRCRPNGSPCISPKDGKLLRAPLGFWTSRTSPIGPSLPMPVWQHDPTSGHRRHRNRRRKERRRPCLLLEVLRRDQISIFSAISIASAFNLRMSEQKLDCAKIAGAPVDQNCLRPAQWVSPKLGRIEPDARHPLLHEANVLTCCEATLAVPSSRKQYLTCLATCQTKILVNRETGLIRQFEAYWPAGLLLPYCGAIHRITAGRHVIDANSNNVTAAQLAVDG